MGITEGGNQDGYTVAVAAETDEASFQKANRNIGDLEKGLGSLSKIDLSKVAAAVKEIAAGMAGVVNFTVETNMDEVQNLLKAAKAGLTNDAFKRWSSIELQLGLSTGSLTKDLSAIYEQVARIKTKGDLNKDQFLSLGLVGASAEAFINEKDMTKRVMMVMDLAMRSDRPLSETASLLSEGLGSSFGDLFYMLKLTGKSFDELFNKMTVFTDAASQSSAVAFESELGAAKSSVSEMGALLASSIDELLTPFLVAFNEWVRKYKDILYDILTFSDDWVGKLSRVVAGVPEYNIYRDTSLNWIGPDKGMFGAPQIWTDTKAKVPVEGASYSAIVEGYKKYLALYKQLTAPGASAVSYKDVEGPSAPAGPWRGLAIGGQRDLALQLYTGFAKSLLPSYYNEVFQGLVVGANEEGLAGLGAAGLTSEGLGRGEYIRTQNAAFDQQLALAITKMLGSGTTSDLQSAYEMLMGAASRAMPTKGVPGLEGSFFSGEKILQDKDLQLLWEFIKKWNPGSEASSTSQAPIQQANTISLVLPNVTTREQGLEVGQGLQQGLGARLGKAFQLSEQSVGAFG